MPVSSIKVMGAKNGRVSSQLLWIDLGLIDCIVIGLWSLRKHSWNWCASCSFGLQTGSGLLLMSMISDEVRRRRILAMHTGVDVNVSRLPDLIASPFGRLTDGRLMVYAHVFNPHNFILSYRPKMYLTLRSASLKGQAIYDVFSVSCYAYIHHNPKSSSSSCSHPPLIHSFAFAFFSSPKISMP